MVGWIQFVWIPSHAGISKHDHVDKLPIEACSKDIVNIDLVMPLARVGQSKKFSYGRTHRSDKLTKA